MWKQDQSATVKSTETYSVQYKEQNQYHQMSGTRGVEHIQFEMLNELMRKVWDDQRFTFYKDDNMMTQTTTYEMSIIVADAGISKIVQDNHFWHCKEEKFSPNEIDKALEDFYPERFL